MMQGYGFKYTLHPILVMFCVVCTLVCGLVLPWRRITSDIFLVRWTQGTQNSNFL